MPDRSDQMYLASIISILQELVSQQQQTNERIMRLLDELADEAWFSDRYKDYDLYDFDPYEHLMD